MLEGRVEAALRSGKVEAIWSNEIKNLTYASPDMPPAGARSATLVANSSAGPFVVRHVEPIGSQRPFGFDRRCIGGEAGQDPGGMPAQSPYGGPDGVLGLRGQAVKRRFQIGPALAFHID